MTLHERFGAALTRLASGTSVLRTRACDQERAERNGGTTREQHLEAAVVQLERAADELWSALER